MITHIKKLIRQELADLNFRTKPFFIIITTIFILVIPRYRHYVWDAPEAESTLFLRLLFPIVIILVVFREKLTDYGLGIGKIKKGLVLSLIFAASYIPFFLILSSSEFFFEYYRSTLYFVDGWKSLAMGGIHSFFNLFKDEFFFRGFLLFGLRRYFDDAGAITIQTLPYSLLHVGKPELECYGSVPVGIALGYLAIKTNSIWYGLVLHWVIAVSFNFMVVYYN